MVMVVDRNSDTPQIAVNANNIRNDDIDCGITRLGWCRSARCLRFARLRTFIIVLIIAGLFQGSCESYFRISAKEAALANGYNPLVVDWLLVSSGIFQAIFALVVTHFAHKLHPISWLGGIIMLQSAVSLIAVIPSIMAFSNNSSASARTTEVETCIYSQMQQQKARLSPEQSSLLTLILLFILQLALGLSSLAYYTIGVTYIDDNSPSLDSPAAIATTLGARLTGFQLGLLLSMAVEATATGWWLGWAILGPLVFISGLLLSLFPKRLPKTVIHLAAQQILEENTTRNFGSQFSTYIDDVGFGPSVRRLFNNKLLMCNILGIMFIQSAYTNYSLQEESYLQSRFYLPFNEQDGLAQEWKARFLAYFFRPPVAAVSMLIGGLVIAKLKLSGRKITAINILLGVLLLGIFISFIFVKCDVGPIAGITNGKLQQPYCSRQCICEPHSFLPVCPENGTVTFFSPCYAGCTTKTTINNIELYEGCSCGNDYESNSWTSIRATEGACSSDSCTKMFTIFQILSLIAASLLGMSIIGKVIISLRSVLPQDKGLALAMELLIFGLFAYVPANLAYTVVTRTYCVYWAPEYSSCLLRETPIHGNVLNIMTASLILAGLFFDVLVFIFAKGLNIYNCKVTDTDYTPSLYGPIPRAEQIHSPASSAIEYSPQTTTTNASPMQRRQPRPNRPAPNPEITVFRNPSSLTNSSAGANSVENASGVTYAQVVFPPDRHKPEDGTTSPKRMAVRADVPLHHLSSQDVRAQLSNLKSFNSVDENNAQIEETKPLVLKTAQPVVKETDLDAIRPQSPETDF